MMNDVQRILLDMQEPLNEELDILEKTLINKYQQASLKRMEKIEQLIKDAWKVSEVEDKEYEQEFRKLKQTLFALCKDVGNDYELQNTETRDWREEVQ